MKYLNKIGRSICSCGADEVFETHCEWYLLLHFAYAFLIKNGKM